VWLLKREGIVGSAESPAMKDEALQLDPDEIDWAFEDILYTRTNDRGLIQFANASFRELAGFSDEELTGAPHKIVRHPETPKGVFWLYWDKLKKGENVCAFVKNRSKQGKGYWVLAVAMPCDGGYLSLRFRPKGELFKKVKPVYRRLLNMEKDKSVSSEDSSGNLMAELSVLGFPNYDAFMLQAMKEEIELRFKHFSRAVPHHVATMDELVADVQRVKEITSKMSVGFRNIRGEPINMRILAGRIEGSGAAVSSISQNYEIMASEMWEELNSMATTEGGENNRMHSSFLNGHLSLLLSEVLREAADHFEETKKAESDPARFEAEEELIKGLLAASGKNAVSRVQAMVESCRSMPDMCRRLRRRVNGLDVVKLFCRVESGRITGSDSGLEGIIERLNKFHSDVDNQLAELSACARTIVQSGKRLHDQMHEMSLKRAA
jgi:aerotaxis receptor